MNPIQRPDSLEMADYTGVLRRRWLIVLVAAIIGVVGAFGYVQVAPKTYTAMTAVFVAPTGADQSNSVQNSRTSGAVNLDTEAQLVTSGTVAALARHILNSPLSTYALSKQISVTVPPNSGVLDIACSTSSASEAAACANAFGKAYLQNRSATATADLTAQIKNLQGKQSAFQAAITSATAKEGKLSKSDPKRTVYKAEITSDRGQLNALIPRIANLTTLAANVSGGRIITAATAPAKPTSPKKSLVLPSGLAAGLVIGLIAAFIWDRRDKRIHTARDVERFIDIPVTLDLPGNAFGKQVSIAAPRSPTGRLFTELGHTVSATLGDGSHVVFVVGASPGRAGSVVAANLAATMARTHPDVVLICADPRDSVAAEMAGVDEGPGLAEVISGDASVREVVRAPAAIPGLWVITPGAETAIPAYYMQHDRAKSLIAQLRRDARYVVIEAPSSDDGTDTFAFAEFADAAVVAVEVPRTTRGELTESVQRLRRLRAPVIGVAVLPPVGRRVKVRPPRQLMPQARDRHDEAGVDAVGRRQETMPAMSTMPAGAQGKRNRATGHQDDYRDPADRIRDN